MIPIYHPINCMVGVMKRLDVPKRYAMEAADMFKSQYGEDPCTAHEALLWDIRGDFYVGD